MVNINMWIYYQSFLILQLKNAMEIGLWKESFNGKYGWVLVKQTVKLKRPLLVGEELIVSTRKGERKFNILEPMI